MTPPKTGLFSAVVTGFIVVTIPSLQEDKTVNLLAQISQQMSSFSVGSKFANSTFQPPSSSAQFQANRSDVQVNTLWTISLSLTLLSAFMAITTQQWIRRVSRPRQMAVRDAVRLRQFHHDGLADWQVPTIISLLPVVVQLSVILFLAGLLLFMQTVNTTVFVALLIVITGIVGPFIIASACPLVWSQCPYKSPLLPTLWTIIRSCSFPVLVTAMVLLLSIVALTYGLSTVVWNIVMSVTPSNHPFARFHAIFMQTIDGVDAWLYYHLRSLFSRHPYESDHFWTARESDFIQKHTSDIDISAFCWSAIGVPTESVEKVADCLYDLPRLKRVHAGLRWAALSMGRSFFDFNQWFVVRTPIYSGVERALRRSTGIYKILSKSFVPQEGDESGKFAWIADNNWAPPQPYTSTKLMYGNRSDNGDAHGGSALALLYHHTFLQGGSKEVRLFKDILMGVRLRQSVQGMPSIHWRWPTVFLYLYAFEGKGVYTASGEYLVLLKTRDDVMTRYLQQT